MKMDKQKIVDQFKILAMAYGLKVMANDLDKAYSSLANELDERDWAKLGLRTALSMLEQVLIINPRSEQAMMAANNILDMISNGFGRISYVIPTDIGDKGLVQTIRLIADLSREYAGDIECLADALVDGKMTDKEACECQQKNRELIKAALLIELHLNHLSR